MKLLIKQIALVICFLMINSIGVQAQVGGTYGDDQYKKEEREHMEMERQRLRFEEEKMKMERQKLMLQNNIVTPPPAAENCPAGYSPSKEKCSAAERKKGCRDAKMPGGLGCISR